MIPDNRRQFASTRQATAATSGSMACSVSTSRCCTQCQFLEAAWLAKAPKVSVAIGIVFCTYDRERCIAAVLRAMADDLVVLAPLDCVFASNQGDQGLAAHAQIARWSIATTPGLLS